MNWKHWGLVLGGLLAASKFHSLLSEETKKTSATVSTIDPKTKAKLDQQYE